MLLGIISDSHSLLPNSVFTAFKDVDAILHAGDIGSIGILGDLGVLAPVYAVAGNCDSPEVQQNIGRRKIVELGGKRFGLFHGDCLNSYRPAAEAAWNQFKEQKVDAIIFGHTHVPTITQYQGLPLFNPGSCTRPRATGGPSVGLITIGATRLDYQHLYLQDLT